MTRRTSSRARARRLRRGLALALLLGAVPDLGCDKIGPLLARVLRGAASSTTSSGTNTGTLNPTTLLGGLLSNNVNPRATVGPAGTATPTLPGRDQGNARRGRLVHRGEASHYGGPSDPYFRKYQGGDTASGEKYDYRKLTAAMYLDVQGREVPLKRNYLVVCTSGCSRRELVVRVNDRGPFAAKAKGRGSYTAVRKNGKLQPHPTRVIDLSAAAMAAFVGWGSNGDAARGKIDVEVYEVM